MAEIQIERKEPRNWLWIVLLLIVLALLAWWLLSRRTDAEDRVATGTLGGAIVDTGPTAATGGAAGDVDAYLSFVQDTQARAAMSNVHEYTADGIRRLAAALNSVVDRDAAGSAAGGGDLRPRLDWLREKADSLQRNPQSNQHAGQARDAFIGATAIMEELRARRPNITDQVRQARDAAESLRERGQLLEQRAEVQRFFERAAEVLRNIAST